jgi:hypothetical protein
MIDFCEQCADGQITENDISDLSDDNRTLKTERPANHLANQLYYWVADRYKVNTRGVQWAEDVFPFLAAVEAGVLLPDAGYEEFQAAREHPICVSVRERTQLEWGALVRDIYGPNPFNPVAFGTAWLTSTVVALARSMYAARDFAAMPILADALEEAGCDVPDVLTHCRDPKGVHVRGCWVVDLVLGKS